MPHGLKLSCTNSAGVSSPGQVARMVILLGFSALLAGCQGQGGVYRKDLQTDSGEPAYITVQHCLISFFGVPEVDASRSKEDAGQLAQELFEKAKGGENFRSIVTRYTSDSAPGIYRLANRGFPSDESSIIPSKRIYSRDTMVPSFGDTAFALEVDEVGLAEYDEKASPFGWHIIKRLE